MANEKAKEAAALAICPMLGDAMVSPSRLAFAREVVEAVIGALYDAGESMVEGSYHDAVCKNIARNTSSARAERDNARKERDIALAELAQWHLNYSKDQPHD